MNASWWNGDDTRDDLTQPDQCEDCESIPCVCETFEVDDEPTVDADNPNSGGFGLVPMDEFLARQGK
jgi:hypothetical protein